MVMLIWLMLGWLVVGVLAWVKWLMENERQSMEEMGKAEAFGYGFVLCCGAALLAVVLNLILEWAL